MSSAVEKARELLKDVTPVHMDCGKLCRAACCKGDGGEGMLLLPGEAGLYKDASWCRILHQGGHDDLLVCDGACDRKSRPFACRIFPMAIFLTEKQIEINVNPLGRPLCPLCHMDLEALSPDFVDAAMQAAEILAKDKDCEKFLMRQTREMEELFFHPLFE
ncbi:MAG: hypothetical protein ACOX88_07565 [Christensenellales bacterium]